MLGCYAVSKVRHCLSYNTYRKVTFPSGKNKWMFDPLTEKKTYHLVPPGAVEAVVAQLSRGYYAQGSWYSPMTGSGCLTSFKAASAFCSMIASARGSVTLLRPLCSVSLRGTWVQHPHRFASKSALICMAWARHTSRLIVQSRVFFRYRL